MNYKDMSIAQLEAERARLHKLETEIHAKFKECGQVLEIRRKQRDMGNLIEKAESEIGDLESILVPEEKPSFSERLSSLWK